MKQNIIQILNKAGIRDVGFCSIAAVEGGLLECRAKQRLPQKAKTVISCLFPYKVREERPKNISRYAAVPDYHRVCGALLEKAAAELKKQIDGYLFEPFIDNSPIPEVYAAAASGLGKVGKNGLLINEKYGSFVFIGEIVTDLDLGIVDEEINGCMACGKCIKLCPKSECGECLSRLSQKKGELNEAEISALKKKEIVWGCDICSEVCPENKNVEKTYIKEFVEGYRDEFSLGEDITGRAYEWRGRKTVERNLLNLKEK